MSPNEAAELLGVSPGATRDEVERAYQARLVGTPLDSPYRDALTSARDALVAATAWRAPQALPTPPVQPAQPTQTAPPGHPAQPYAPQRAPGQPQPPFAPPPPYQGSGHDAFGSAPGGGGAYPGSPPPRTRMSTGAVVGITVGGVLGGLAVLLVAVLAFVSIGASASRIAQAESESSASPYPGDPGDGSSDEPSDPGSGDAGSGDPGSDDSEVDDYDIDGVHIHYVDGWTFELTPGQSCAGATVTATFADTPDGETLDSWSTTVDLEAGVPYALTIPDDASDYDYAGIDSVQCGQA